MRISCEFYGRSVPNALLNTLGSTNQASRQLILRGGHLSLFGTNLPYQIMSSQMHKTSTPICITSPTSPEPPSPLVQVYLLSSMSLAVSVSGGFSFEA